MLGAWLLLLAAAARAADLPVVTVTADDTRIAQSCRIRIPTGMILPDAAGDGVVILDADGITVEFAPGTVLRGAPEGTPWDRLRGVGIRLEGRSGVRLVGARVHGYKNGVVISGGIDAGIEGGDFSDNYRQRLRSTPAGEDGADWMYPHHNDRRKWREEYGGAVCVENARAVTIRGITVRRGQNGIVLDRVEHSRVYDNDCSFLSGWGLAMWRSSDNVISRNAFDFCVRGHVEGVYNRGNDSAGILCFEQCNRNMFVENSATHGGDGFFGFAGHEAIGETWMNQERERLRRETGRREVDDLIRVPEELATRLSALGCNDNVLIGNDFSYASAHGIEMTFSEGNIYARNRIVENAICGLWGGYSSKSLIVENEFDGNGGMAYGLERGAINMEHAAHNLIAGNRFVNNHCALHFWWNPGPLHRFPGVAGGEFDVTGNTIWGNHIEINPDHPFTLRSPADRLLVLQLRDPSGRHVHGNVYAANTVHLTVPAAREFDLDEGTAPATAGAPPRYALPAIPTLGTNRPVNARPELRGRDRIVLDEWGPWDHERPLIRRGATRVEDERMWEIFGLTAPLSAEVRRGEVALRVDPSGPGQPARVHLRAPAGVHDYRIALRSGGWEGALAGMFVSAAWELTFFSSTVDPMQNLEGWRALAKGPDAVSAAAVRLNFDYADQGPRHLGLSDAVGERGPQADRFGMIARARLKLPAGRWRLVTVSDDGVRVRIDGLVAIENWTIHGPTRDEAVFERAKEGEAEVTVEHFDHEGPATLRLELEPMDR